MARIVFLIIIYAIACSADAQQMVVIKKGSIIARYNLGDPIRYVTKDGLAHNAAILSIRDFEFVTLQKDTIKFADVARLKFKNKSMKFVKSTLVGSAGLLALHFALKGPYGDTNPNAVKGLAYASAAGVFPVILALLTSRSQIKLNGFKRLKFVNYDSPLYR